MNQRLARKHTRQVPSGASLRITLSIVAALSVLNAACQSPTVAAGSAAPSTTVAARRPTSTDGTVRFAVIGDFGLSSSNERAVANLVKSWQADFVITVGDNNYPSGAQATIDANIGQYYADYIHPYTGAYASAATTNRFFPTLGNHDWMSAGAAPYLGYFTLPGNERYYDFARGPVHLFALDSDAREPDGTASTSRQAEWLRQTMSASSACWQVVYFHQAPYSSGMHGSYTRMRWPFRAWGADAVLAGHDHTYERVLSGGLTYFVNGLGGSTRYNFRLPVAGSQARYNAGFGALLVTASRTKLTFEFITTDGTLVDTHTLEGGCAGGK